MLMVALGSTQYSIALSTTQFGYNEDDAIHSIDIEISCGLPLIGSSFADQLSAAVKAQQGKFSDHLVRNSNSSRWDSSFNSTTLDYPVKLVIDFPQGFALRELQKIAQEKTQVDPTDHTLHTKAKMVVITFSSCAEYWEDLWDLQPHVLLVNPQKGSQIVDAVVRTCGGDSYRHVPSRSIPISATERQALKCLALGGTNKQIAEQLCLQDQTVMNMLSAIYKKLNLKNRAEAIHYYWGGDYTYYTQASFPSK
jgi:DNA-binding NarL/FixJ family response regulator